MADPFEDVRRQHDMLRANGVLGIAYALSNPQAQMTLVDESFMAVQSAQAAPTLITGLTYAQEKEVIDDTRLFVEAVSALNLLPLEQIVYHVPDTSSAAGNGGRRRRHCKAGICRHLVLRQTGHDQTQLYGITLLARGSHPKPHGIAGANRVYISNSETACCQDQTANARLRTFVRKSRPTPATRCYISQRLRLKVMGREDENGGSACHRIQ